MPCEYKVVQDYFGEERNFYYECASSKIQESRCSGLNAHTFYIRKSEEDFPGRYINPPWGTQSVSAHANTCETAEFFTARLPINARVPSNWRYFSSIESFEDGKNDNESYNVYWSRGLNQAYFGQQPVFSNGNRTQSESGLCCFAVAKDIVTHEFTHALVNWTIEESIGIIDHKNETGALYESYADTFGILMKNLQMQNINDWNWEIGSGFGEDGGAIRNFQTPEDCFSTLRDDRRVHHPRNMDRYIELPEDELYGGIHINCSIHNHAIYLILNSDVFQPNNYLDIEMAADFFYQVLRRLTPLSNFVASRVKMREVAKTFRISETAICQAFDEVGIREDVLIA